MDPREETARLFNIAEILMEDVICGEEATVGHWRSEFSEGANRMMKTLGITRADGSCDDSYVQDFCDTFSDDPIRLYGGLFFQSGACDGGSNYFCIDGCKLAELCPSCFDPLNRSEECGQ